MMAARLRCSVIPAAQRGADRVSTGPRTQAFGKGLDSPWAGICGKTDRRPATALPLRAPARPYQRTPHSLSRCTVLREVVMGTRRVKKSMVDSLVLAGRCPERQSCLDKPVIWLMSDKGGILDTFFEFHSSSLLHLKGETLWLGKHRASSRSPSAWKSTPTPAPTCKRRGFKAAG